MGTRTRTASHSTSDGWAAVERGTVRVLPPLPEKRREKPSGRSTRASLVRVTISARRKPARAMSVRGGASAGGGEESGEGPAGGAVAEPLAGQPRATSAARRRRTCASSSVGEHLVRLALPVHLGEVEGGVEGVVGDGLDGAEEAVERPDAAHPGGGRSGREWSAERRTRYSSASRRVTRS